MRCAVMIWLFVACDMTASAIVTYDSGTIVSTTSHCHLQNNLLIHISCCSRGLWWHESAWNMHILHACFVFQARVRCLENWRRRKGSRSCTPPSFRVSSTAAYGWWRELWPKTVTSFSTTAAETWRTKRGEQGGGRSGTKGERMFLGVLYCKSTCECLLARLELRNASDSCPLHHCRGLGASLYFKINIFPLMSHSRG